MITCKKCGNQIEDGNTICPNCGENLLDNNTINNDTMNDKTQIFKGGLINNLNSVSENQPEQTSEPITETPIELQPEQNIETTEPTPEPITETPIEPQPELNIENAEPIPEPVTEPQTELNFEPITETPSTKPEPTPEPTIQSFDNNSSSSTIQSFDNNVAQDNPSIQSFDNNVNHNNPTAQVFENSNSVATNMGQKKDNKIIIIVVAIAVVVVAAIILLLPIFNNKTVECTKEETENGISIKSEMITNFNGNKVNTITIKATYTLDSKYDEYVDVFYNSIKEEAKEYEKLNGVKVSTNKNGNVISFTVTSNRESAEKLFETNFEDKDESPSSFIKAAEDQGMTCKK